jgi:ubiquinone/menaquinone biosynthesis C-methylase UbiE
MPWGDGRVRTPGASGRAQTSTDDLRRLWDAETEKYRHRSSALADFPLPAEFLPRPGERVLDAGCGAGTFMGMYRQITASVHGLDFSRAMARAAACHGPTVQGDVQWLPFRDQSFDYVSSHVVINHVLDDRRALAELARVSKTAGRVLVVVPNWVSFLAPGRVLMTALGRYTLGFSRHYTPSMLRRAGRRVGLSVQRMDTIPKKPTSSTAWRRLPSWSGYVLDQGLRRLHHLWGGDLAVLFEKSGG